MILASRAVVHGLILSKDGLTSTSTQMSAILCDPQVANTKSENYLLILGRRARQTNINYLYTDSWLGSHSLFTAYHQLPCESYWKVNEEHRDMKAAQTSCHRSGTSCTCMCVWVGVCVCIPSGGCSRLGCACHFLIIDNEAQGDCSERWRGNGIWCS